MEMTSRQAALVDIRDFSDGITATIPREEFAAALTSEEPAELFLEVARPGSDDKADVAVTWSRDELEQLLGATKGPTVTLAFKRDELERALDEPEVEMHGLRDKALVLTIAAAAAAGGATTAAAATHDEAGLTARGITPSYVAVHDEATLAARGIESVVASAHDEATLAARGIEPTVAASHDEATLAARGIEPTVAASHDEATLAARGIEPGSLPATHDEATLVARGIAPAPATPTGDDGGFAIDMPAADGTTAAIAGGLAGLGLLITAAGFATRRQRTGHPA
jgi:hypothetical protein